MKNIASLSLLVAMLMSTNVQAGKTKDKEKTKKEIPMMSFEECCDLHDDTSTCQSLSNVKNKAGKSCPKVEEEYYDDSEIYSEEGE